MEKASHIILLFSFLCLLDFPSLGQEKSALSLNLGYFNDNGRVQYLVANAKTRVNGRFAAREGVEVSFYISSPSPANLLGKGTTNKRGDAVLFIPPSARDEWNKSPKQSFLAVVAASSAFDEATANADVVKSRIQLDTAEGKTIVATVFQETEKGWIPAKDVDIALVVRRLGSNLGLSSTATHTTDSAGKVETEYKLQDLPGDDSGNVVLMVKIDASDTYGTVTREKKVPWGAIRSYTSDFDKRTLFSRRGLSPLWLGFIASSITLAVWSVLIYLLFQIRKIRKIGRTLTSS